MIPRPAGISLRSLLRLGPPALSIRLRLTLLYSALLVVTLVASSIGIYAAVSNVTLSAQRDALTAEVRTVATSLQPHLGPPGPNQGGGGGPYQGQNAPPANQGQSHADDQNAQGGTLANFIPPPDVAQQRAIQVRNPDGRVIYRSSDLQDAKVTLPLSATARQHLKPNSIAQTIVSVGGQRLLIANTLIATHHVGGILQVADSLKQLDQTLATLQKILLIGVVIVTLLAFGAGWWLAGTALHPINRITQTAQEIGATQDFSRRVAYTGPADEIGRLAGTFNTMLARLQSAFQAQRRFVADASHELRTPLTSIRGNLGLLERRPPIAEADRVAVIADLVSESERLSRLVADLLTLARTDTGRPLRQEPVPLSPLVAEVIRRLAVLHPDRLIQEGAHSDAAAMGDRDALTQVLLILLDNALKFTPADGTVTVTTNAQAGTVTVTVRDTGPGIAPHALPHIFERFYQGDAARVGVGTGLGLSIARPLVEGMRGTITVESKAGEGSAFTVTLPRATARKRDQAGHRSQEA